MKGDRLLILLFALFMLSLSGGAIFLFQRSVALEDYNEQAALLQRAEQLDLKLDRDVQRILSLQLQHYDTLVETVNLIRENQQRFNAQRNGLRGAVDANFDIAIEAYFDVSERKLQILERLKSQVALLRNSLQYLPGLIQEFDALVAEEHKGIGTGLFSALLNYNLFPGDEYYQVLEAQIAALNSLQLDERAQELLNYILLHLQSNIHVRSEIAGQVASYEAQPSAAMITRLRSDYASFYRHESDRFYYTSLSLFVVVLTLFTSLGYAFLHLRRARRKSAEAGRQLHDALESISEAFVLFDRELHLVQWNRKYAELFPATVAMLQPGTPYRELVRARIEHGEYQVAHGEEETLRERLLATLRQTEKQQVETLADGRHYLVSNSPTSDGGIASVQVDITERRRTEEQLRIAAAVFETSNEGIVVTDHYNRIMAVNPSFSRITGYSSEEVLGLNPSILSSGRHDGDFYRSMWQGLYRDGQWEGEIWNRNKAGEIYPEWLSLSVIRDEAGAIIEHIAVFSDITRRKQDEEQIRWQANYDALTGLPNRTLFADRLRSVVSSSHREGWISALLFIDLDHFKVVNDSQGHAVGDELLQEVAKRLQECVREADTVARLGGDEFTIILQDITHTDDAALVAGKVIARLAESFQLEGGEVFIGASIGITLYPNDALDAEALIRNADMAMYRAKEAGRNGYRFFTPAMNAQMVERMRLEQEMRVAIERDEFHLVFQPIIDQQSGAMVRAEALLRWHHPQMGAIPPERFIPLAEESGLIVSLGNWVLQEACATAAAWYREGIDIGVSINISSRQIKNGLKVEEIAALLDTHRLPPQLLSLEITESLLLEDSEESLQWLNRIKSLGVRLSVDDFGTGFSSLSYLKRFPVDTIKIDRSFVQDVISDPDDAALTRAIIGLAESFNMDVIAEGVENGEQLDFLRQHGCHLIQGYFYSTPLSAAALRQYAAAEREPLPA